MKAKEEKKQWILDYITDPMHKEEFFDITAEPFVEAYIDKFNPRIVEWYAFGAPKVQELGSLLSELFKEGKICRYRHYCEWCVDGYPRWFYVYYPNKIS